MFGLGLIRFRAGGGDPLGYCDYEGHIRDRVLKRGDGSYVAMWRVEGRPWETIEKDLLYSRRNATNDMLVNLASERIVLAAHEVRTLIHDKDFYPPGDLANPFARSLNAVYRQRLSSSGDAPLYQNEQFLSLTIRPVQPMGKAVSNVLKSAQLQADETENETIAFLEERAALIEAGLRANGLSRLGYREEQDELFSEMGEAMVLIHSGRHTHVGVPDGPLGDALYRERTEWGPRKSIRIHQASGRTRYAACFGFKVPSTKCPPWRFNHLKSAPFEYSFSRHFNFLSLVAGEATTAKKVKTLEKTKDPGLDQVEALGTLRSRLIGRRSLMGNHHNVMTVFADSLAGLELVAPEAEAQMARGSASVVREDWADLAAYWSHLPGNLHLWPRPMPVTTDNWASMASLDAYPVGPPAGRWGPPAIVLRSAGGTPVRDHWHRRDKGNRAYFGPTGAGKAQPLDAKVLTPTGFREIGSIRPGDIVTSPDGKSVRVLGFFPQGLKDIYRITFSDGRQTRCCGDHLWKVWDWNHLREVGKSHSTRQTISSAGWKVLPLFKIKEWFDGSLLRAKRAAVPLVTPGAIEFSPGKLPIDPYVLGALLGDGSLSKGAKKVGLTTADQYILETVGAGLPGYECRSVGYPKRPYDYVIRPLAEEKSKRVIKGQRTISLGGHQSSPSTIVYGGRELTIKRWATAAGISVGTLRWRLAHWTTGQALGVEPKPTRHWVPLVRSLKDLGVLDKPSHEKFVPLAYKLASSGQRLALLQGLMDTDGSVSKKGTHASFSSTSERLAQDVQEIAWSVGAIARIRKRQTRYTYKGKRLPGRPSWRVSIVHPDIAMIFSLPRKVAQCRKKAMVHRLGIEKIEFVGQELAACISVDHPSGLYVTDDYVVTHNTTAILAKLAQTERYDPMPQIVYFDQYRGAEIGIRALAGAENYHVLQDGIPTRFNPLKGLNPESPRDMACLRYIARGLIGIEMDREQQRSVAIALQMTMELDREDRDWETVRAFLGFERGGIGERLEPWCRGNELGWALDCDEDHLSFKSRISGYDTTQLLSNELALAAIQGYLAYRTEAIIDGRRAIIVIDEFHHWLENLFWAKRAASLARTIRRRNGVLVMLTQHPADLAKSQFGKTILQQTPQQWFAPDPKATMEDYIGGAQLTEPMFEKIKRGMREGAGLFLRVIEHEAMVVELPLGGLDAHMAVLSSRDAAVDLANEIRQTAGDNWLSEFMARHEEAKA